MPKRVFVIIILCLFAACSQNTPCEQCWEDNPNCFSCCDYACGVIRDYCDSSVDMLTCAYSEECGCINLKFSDECGPVNTSRCKCIRDRCVDK